MMLRRIPTLPKIYASLRRFSAVRHLDLKQGDTLRLELEHVQHSKINISSLWQDHCDMESKNESNSYQIDVTELCEQRTWTVSAKPNKERTDNNALDLHFNVPEYVNLHITSVSDLSLVLSNKVRFVSFDASCCLFATTTRQFQGDCTVRCKSGSVKIDKLRGEVLDFDCGTGTG